MRREAKEKSEEHTSNEEPAGPSSASITTELPPPRDYRTAADPTDHGRAMREQLLRTPRWAKNKKIRSSALLSSTILLLSYPSRQHQTYTILDQTSTMSFIGDIVLMVMVAMIARKGVSFESFLPYVFANLISAYGGNTASTTHETSGDVIAVEVSADDLGYDADDERSKERRVRRKRMRR